MVKTFRKSQAAMEFLMTYGWAILVVLVAIGALAYFGVLSPDRFLPEKCQLPSGIACIDHKVTTSTVEVVLRNGLGFDMEPYGGSGGSIIVSIATNHCGAEVTSATPHMNGEDVTYTISCPGMTSGNKLSGSLAVKYRNGDSKLDHISNGSITSKVT